MKKVYSVVSGKVVPGKGKGKKLGFPTINIELKEKIESGVYKGKVRTCKFNNNSRIRANVKRRRANINSWSAGIFVSPHKGLLEAHLIGFSGDLRGKEVEVEIGEKIREVMKFESDKKLRDQIEKDIEYICLQG